VKWEGKLLLRGFGSGKRTYHARITKQLYRLGVSCDWSRERFTMDEGCSQAVRKVFVDLYRRGLIYRGDYMINWCPRCHTALSDIEVEHEERIFNPYSHHVILSKMVKGLFRSPPPGPKRCLGDTGVAVHPEDDRYRNLVGKKLSFHCLAGLYPLWLMIM
jgi:valyl-tRNA synthetase